MTPKKTMNPPFDKEDLVWRNQLLSAATRRSSTMLQEAAANSVNYRQLQQGAHPLARGVPHLPQGMDPRHYGPQSSMNPQECSMLRLMMLRSQVQHDALKVQNESVLGLPNHQGPHPFHPQARPIPVPNQYTQFIEAGPIKSLPPMNAVAPSQYLEMTPFSVPPEPQKPTAEPQSFAATASNSAPPPQKPTAKSETKPKVAKKKQGEKKAGPNKKDTKWKASLAQLVEFRKEFGDCIVPRGYAPNPSLASWVAEQRKQYKLRKDGKPSSITPERIEHLNELNFAWNAQDAAWERHFEDLKKFRNEFGDCLVPLGNPNYPKLGLWIKEQRRHYSLMKQGKKSHMTEDRALALDSIGFCWDTHEQIWGERLRELCAFRAVHGDCLVPTSYPQNNKLGTWVHHQRRQYKKFQEGKPCHITTERIRALESIGFVSI